VVAGDEVELGAARVADVAESRELELGIGLVGGVMEFGDVAVHDHAVEVGHQRLERIGAACTIGASEVEVAQDQGAWDARGAHLGGWGTTPLIGARAGSR
jgi:hypothetical protein